MVPKWYRLLAYPGFIVAMVWIYLFANEIVGLLETFGRVFDISDALLGMTVLAMGNSIGGLLFPPCIAGCIHVLTFAFVLLLQIPFRTLPLPEWATQPWRCLRALVPPC
jgi:hypothetical protein